MLDCRMSWHRADSKQQTSLQHLRQEVRGSPLRGSQATGVGVDTRPLGMPGDFSGAREAWRDWITVFKEYAGAAVPRLQKLMDDVAKAGAPAPKCHDPGGRRSGSVGTALLDVALDLLGCSSQHRVPGRRQRRSRGMVTTDREVRAEDENTFCRAADVNPVLLTSS